MNNVVVNFMDLTVTNQEGQALTPTQDIHVADVIKNELESFVNKVEDAKRFLHAWDDFNTFVKHSDKHGLVKAMQHSGKRVFIVEFEANYMYELVAGTILDTYFGMDVLNAYKEKIDYENTKRQLDHALPEFKTAPKRA